MEDALKYTLAAMASLLLLSSCSWFRNLERSLVEDDEKQMKRSGRAVPREQYDQLLVKYEELSKKYEASKGSNPQPEVPMLTNDLETETVNVFPMAEPSREKEATELVIPKDIESQLSLYRRAIALKERNPGEATKLFQQLENHGIDAVQARARFQIGEMLLAKDQYDLALQVFEEIITKNASSGVVLQALDGAVKASEKLGLANKKDQYKSMLNDVFGS